MWDATVVGTVPKVETLESLYVINKQAKKYQRRGDESYRKGKGATAKKNSVRKKALYAVKEKILSRICEEADQLNYHIIGGRGYWFLRFGDFSFHSPSGSLSMRYDKIGDVTELEDFNPTEEKEKTNRSLKDSLLFFEKAFGVNANKHLEREYISYGHNRYFAGWSYLGDS